MTKLNDGKPRKIKSTRPYSFILEEDTTNFGSYEKGSIVTQVKQPKVLNFKPLREALKDPGDFLLSEFSKFDRPPLLHLAFQALDKFISELGCFPVAGSEEDAQKLISIVSDINEGSGDGKLNDINPKLLQYFAFGARVVLNPMAAMFGGIVGQEVVKACSGKFHPLFQDDIHREAQTMSLIDHPNVIRAYCSFVVDRNLWVVMPFMAEGSCLHLMKIAYPDGFEEFAIGSILKETLKALEYLHEHGHIHHDVKAGNILLDTNGVVKLADFGVSACCLIKVIGNAQEILL